MALKIDEYFALTKITPKLPQLDFKTPNEKELEALLKPVESIISISDSEISGSVESDIPDMFEEEHKNSFLRPFKNEKNRTKFLKKHEADQKTVEMFTDDFKKVLKTTRDSLNIDYSLTLENVEQINQVLDDDNKESFLKPTSAKKITIVKEPISVRTEDDQDSSTTSNSGLWNMIKANRSEYFRASPPGFDVYEDEENVENYLMRPYIPWNVIDRSLKKCEEWLREQN